jgi:hypothetical protein
MSMLERTAELHLTRDRQGRRIYKGGCFRTRSYLVESEMDRARVLALTRLEIIFTGVGLLLLPAMLTTVADRGLRWLLVGAVGLVLTLAYAVNRRRLESQLRRAEA